MNCYLLLRSALECEVAGAMMRAEVDCGHCGVLNFSEEECLCCREMEQPVTAAQLEKCITEHPEFHLLCLNIAVLCILYCGAQGLHG
ncbi:hypothetical protein HPB52_004356 [Rhipicephalus sanguineus]|uniref:Uncharacterized protein n=1 Tax=Rhipicephalus sanguineus TaxID=34632 RepID=A0A9D4PBB1_RHISA|nr:hypothetical protein HPB52_004356 [Rhipicephalus sanguineus]